MPLCSKAAELSGVNILLFAKEQAERLGPGDRHQFQLSPIQQTHVFNVLRASLGDRLRIGEINGLVGHGTLQPNGIIQIEHLSSKPPAKPNLDIILALPRPKNLRRCLRASANFGVRNIHVIHSYRVEKSYWQSPLLSESVVQQALLAGLQIAGDTVLPGLHLHRYFKPFVEDVAPTFSHAHKLIAASTGGQLRENRCWPATVTGQTIAAIGPEGGFLPYEVELFQAAGFDIVDLGERILSVENALSAVCAFAL